MLKSHLSLIFFILFPLKSINVSAAQPTDFDDKPTSEICKKTLVSYMLFQEAKEKGYSQADALKLNAGLKPGEKLPVEAIRYAYEYSWLDKRNLTSYTFWACHAKEIGIPIKPLSSVAKEMQECIEKDLGKNCMYGVRNRILGLPENYQKIEKLRAPSTTPINSQ